MAPLMSIPPLNGGCMSNEQQTERDEWELYVQIKGINHAFRSLSFKVRDESADCTSAECQETICTSLTFSLSSSHEQKQFHPSGKWLLIRSDLLRSRGLNELMIRKMFGV